MYSVKVDLLDDSLKFTTDFGLAFYLPNYSLSFMRLGQHDQVDLTIAIPASRHWAYLEQARLLIVTRPDGEIGMSKARWAFGSGVAGKTKNFSVINRRVMLADAQSGLDQWASMFIDPLQAVIVAGYLADRVRKAVGVIYSTPTAYSTLRVVDAEPYYKNKNNRVDLEELMVSLSGPLG